MSTGSPTTSSSSSTRQTKDMPRSPVYTLGGGAIAPMPSLMSHPPQQQRVPPAATPVAHAMPYEVQRRLSQHQQPPPPPWLTSNAHNTNAHPIISSRTPSPNSSPGSSPTPSHSSPLPYGASSAGGSTTGPNGLQQDFPCPFCHQVYKKVGHLNRHVLTHSGTRFACEFKGCDKTFSRLDNMRTHVKNMHPGH